MRLNKYIIRNKWKKDDTSYKLDKRELIIPTSKAVNHYQMLTFLLPPLYSNYARNPIELFSFFCLVLGISLIPLAVFYQSVSFAFFAAHRNYLFRIPLHIFYFCAQFFPATPWVGLKNFNHWTAFSCVLLVWRIPESRITRQFGNQFDHCRWLQCMVK